MVCSAPAWGIFKLTACRVKTLTCYPYLQGASVKNIICVVQESSPGAYRVEGEGSAAEPATHMQTRHLPVSGDA